MPLSMKPFERGSGGRLDARTLTEPALCTALLFGLQVALAALPNIEVVTLLVMLYTRWFGRRALFIIYLFALLEGVFYGFHLWWLMYLYVWTILWLAVTWLEERLCSTLSWAVLGGAFGLVFGFLCSFPYLAVGSVRVVLGWWIAGLPFDLIHGCINFVLILTLFAPLDSLYRRIRGRDKPF